MSHDSAGVFLQLQDQIFPDKENFGRVFRNNAILSSKGIFQVSAIMGPCVAGGAYLPIMSDESIIVEKTGSIFLAGSHLVKAAIGEIIEKEDFERGEGDEAPYNILRDYKKMISSKINLDKKLKVVLDCGNAAGAVCAPEIFRNFNIDLEELYCDVDGTFPNHHPDPTVKKNLKDLIEKMKTGRFDVGIAFDGDADRIGVVDEKGDVIWADLLMALFLPEIISPGDEILFDVKCSKSLEEMITNCLLYTSPSPRDRG